MPCYGGYFGPDLLQNFFSNISWAVGSLSDQIGSMEPYPGDSYIEGLTVNDANNAYSAAIAYASADTPFNDFFLYGIAGDLGSSGSPVGNVYANGFYGAADNMTLLGYTLSNSFFVDWMDGYLVANCAQSLMQYSGGGSSVYWDGNAWNIDGGSLSVGNSVFLVEGSAWSSPGAIALGTDGDAAFAGNTYIDSMGNLTVGTGSGIGIAGSHYFSTGGEASLGNGQLIVNGDYTEILSLSIGSGGFGVSTGLYTNGYYFQNADYGRNFLEWGGDNSNGAPYWFDASNNWRLTGDGSGLTNLSFTIAGASDYSTYFDSNLDCWSAYYSQSSFNQFFGYGGWNVGDIGAINQTVGNVYAETLNAANGFSGTGTYSTFTIVNGIITDAS